MKKLLILGSCNATYDIIQYCKKNNIYTIVTDDRTPEISFAKKWSDEYWMINTSRIDELEIKCKKEKINGVICGLSEFNIEQMIKLTKRLGLPCYCDDYSWHFSKDKDDFKKKCMEIGVPVAKGYNILSDSINDNIEFPVVVKPVDQNGNRGISYCYNNNDLKEAIKFARKVSNNPKLIVEKMLSGKEWYSFYAIANGEPRLVALNGMYSQPGELKNLYSITSTISDNIKRFINEVNPKILLLLKSIKCNDGIAWVQEMLDSDDKFYVIEMGYRLPGDMTYLQYPFLNGFDTIKWLVDYALGNIHTINDLPVGQCEAFKEIGCSYNIWVSKEAKLLKLEGLDSILSNENIILRSTIKQNDTLRKHGHIGTFVFNTNSFDEMKQIIMKINSNLKVIDANGDDIFIRYDDFDYLNKVYLSGISEL